MKVKKQYHYTECGLKNVYIDGLHFANDDGEEAIVIPNIQALHWLIAKEVIGSQSIDGDEIRFLRTEMGYTPKQLAEKLKIAERTLKSMENGKTKIKANVDLKLRELGFSLLIAPKCHLYNTGTKKKARQIEVFQPNRKSSSSYRLQQIA